MGKNENELAFESELCCGNQHQSSPIPPTAINWMLQKVRSLSGKVYGVTHTDQLWPLFAN